MVDIRARKSYGANLINLNAGNMTALNATLSK